MVVLEGSRGCTVKIGQVVFLAENKYHSVVPIAAAWVHLLDQ